MLNEDRSGARRYQDEVPAVARAVRVLESLTASRHARPLAELARELGVGASSLLAILTTLRRAGLVHRDSDGHYEAGSGLVALGSAVACKRRACERFASVASQLLAAHGETVLLWMRQGDTFILAASREGTQPLRFVPTPGLRLRADETALDMLTCSGAPAIEEELLPGVWSVAVALPAGPDELAYVALAGPRDRLISPAILATMLAVVAPGAGVTSRQSAPTTTPLHSGSTDAAWEIATSGPIGDDELDGFLRQSLLATLSYLADDGYPATVPLWYAWDGSAFWLASRPGSEWAEHVRLDPRVSLAVSESTPPLRRVLARGELAEIDDRSGAHWAAVETQLAARYAGFEAAREPGTAGRGRLLKLVPERLIAWRGLLRYPKLPPGPDRPGTTSWRHLG